VDDALSRNSLGQSFEESSHPRRIMPRTRVPALSDFGQGAALICLGERDCESWSGLHGDLQNKNPAFSGAWLTPGAQGWNSSRPYIKRAGPRRNGFYWLYRMTPEFDSGQY